MHHDAASQCERSARPTRSSNWSQVASRRGDEAHEPRRARFDLARGRFDAPASTRRAADRSPGRSSPRPSSSTRATRFAGLADSKVLTARGARGTGWRDPRAQPRLGRRLGRRRRDRCAQHPAGDVARDAPRTAGPAVRAGARDRRRRSLPDSRGSRRSTAAIEAVVDGDASVACVSAASILAKVARDAFMRELERCYPGYGLAIAQGLRHARASRRPCAQLGPTPMHRRSFAPVQSALLIRPLSLAPTAAWPVSSTCTFTPSTRSSTASCASRASGRTDGQRA